MNCESKCWFGVSYVNLRHRMLYGRSISLSNTQSWNWIVNCSPSQGLITTMSIAYNFKELEIKAKFNFFRVFVHCVVFFFFFLFHFYVALLFWFCVLIHHASCSHNPFRLIGVGLSFWTFATAGCGSSFDFWSIAIFRM